MITRYRSVVAPEHVEAALRVIWNDLMRRGILPDEVDNYRRTSEWFPWLKTNPALERLRDSLNRRFGKGWFSTDPQIVFQPPRSVRWPPSSRTSIRMGKVRPSLACPVLH